MDGLRGELDRDLLRLRTRVEGSRMSCTKVSVKTTMQIHKTLNLYLVIDDPNSSPAQASSVEYADRTFRILTSEKVNESYI